MSGLDYRSAGVDIDAGEAAKERIRSLVEATFNERTRGAFGAFGGMSSLPAGMRRPLLVASADGVGSKLRVAIAAQKHDTIGQDLVNHCVNDILAQGARPLFFLDYVAFGRLEAQVLEEIVSGLARACREHDCALIGGETAEMPGLYTPPDYDLAGFIVGTVEEDAVLGSHRVQAGDVLIGLPSSGLHTNGYSLARKIVFDNLALTHADRFPGTEVSVGEVLLAVHRSYFRCLEPLLSEVNALAHITGGGLPGNLDRILPGHCDALVDTASWTIPQTFRVLADAGSIARDEMFRTFNMGVGMVVAVSPERADRVLSALSASECGPWVIGEVGAGSGKVRLV
ncbi:MAG TPA: phosphoribosylformylglycinamidine cyclo-ligase [Gemmatimonadaceae bacterium]